MWIKSNTQKRGAVVDAFFQKSKEAFHRNSFLPQRREVRKENFKIFASLASSRFKNSVSPWLRFSEYHGKKSHSHIQTIFHLPEIRCAGIIIEVHADFADARQRVHDDH